MLAHRGGSSFLVAQARLLQWILMSSAWVTCLFLNQSPKLCSVWFKFRANLSRRRVASVSCKPQRWRVGWGSSPKENWGAPSRRREAWWRRTQRSSFQSPLVSPRGFQGVCKWHHLGHPVWNQWRLEGWVHWLAAWPQRDHWPITQHKTSKHTRTTVALLSNAQEKMLAVSEWLGVAVKRKGLGR